jgi:NADH-quinone oxidoreductase subunit G
MTAHLDVHEPPPPQDPDAPLSFSMEGYDGRPPPALVGRLWWPGWNSEQAINKFQIEVGGPLQGGEAGQRLIEPTPDKGAAYFSGIPAPPVQNQDQWLIVAAYHIFGSEELSLHSPCIAERAPQPYLGVSAADAKRLGLNEGQPAELTVRQAALEGRTGREWNQTIQLPARIRADLPAGVAALPVGLPGLPVIPLPARGSIGAAGRQAPPPEATA